MSEPRTVQPFILGNTGKVQMDFRPVDKGDEAVEVQIARPKEASNGLQEPLAQGQHQSGEDASLKSQTPSSLTSTAEVTPESSSASDAQSEPNVTNTDEASGSSTDSGVASTMPIEESSQTKTKSETTSQSKSPSLPSLPSVTK